jgi:hypothetical protein
MNNLKTIVDDFIKAQEEFQTKAQASMKEAFKAIFDAYPGIQGFRWTQYAPYFNDGEECVFSVNEISVFGGNLEEDDIDSITGWGDYDGDNELVFTDGYRETNTFAWDRPFVLQAGSNALKKNAPEVSDLVSALQSGALEDVMRATFGNHVQVTANRGGFDVDDYDHD